MSCCMIGSVGFYFISAFTICKLVAFIHSYCILQPRLFLIFLYHSFFNYLKLLILLFAKNLLQSFYCCYFSLLKTIYSCFSLIMRISKIAKKNYHHFLLQCFLFCPLFTSNIGSKTAHFYPLSFSLFFTFNGCFLQRFHHYFFDLLSFFSLFLKSFKIFSLFSFLQCELKLLFIKKKLILN